MRSLAPWLIAVVMMAAPRFVRAGGQAPPAPAPRVLSTVPTPQEGVTPVPAQMSGMPLQVGDLPPGIVAVRVIRGSFQNNVSNQPVQLRAGSGGVRQAATGADGRAQFDGLKIGDIIRVRTSLDGELLESQPFPVPSQGGVRVVLVSGVGAAVANADPWPGPSTGGASAVGVTTTTLAPAGQSMPSASRTPAHTYFIVGLIMATITAGVVFWPHKRPPRQASRSRQELLEQLVQLEKAYEAGDLATEPYIARHEALIEQLLKLGKPVEDEAA